MRTGSIAHSAMDREVSFLFDQYSRNSKGSMSSHRAVEASCARMGPQAARRSTGGFYRGPYISKALYMIIKSAVDSCQFS
jgi:hypothetical protein